MTLERIMPVLNSSSTKRRVPSRLRAAFVVTLLSATALTGFAAGHAGFAADAPAAAIAPVAPAATLPDFTDLVARTKPAVVSITVALRATQAADEGMDTPFGMMRPQRPHAVEARASGFLIDPNGTIVTNNHVVENAKSISVMLDDGTQLPAKLIGRDKRTDLAVIKIDAGHKLPFIQLGDSSKVRPGEWVIAMGNPFGLGGSVTAGIVSASGRDIGEGPYDDFIQVDAPINQGNSGGPLFTQDGRVVGVNTAIFSPSGGSVGIGFAIPSNMVKTIVADLERSGHVTRGYIGVAAQPVSVEMAKALHLPAHAPASAGLTGGNGALVASVEPNSPAAKAGIQPGDVIQAVDGKPVATPRDLAVDVANVKPGSAAKLDLIRNGSAQSISVDTATLQADAGANAGSGEQTGQASVGVQLAEISPEMRNELNLPSRVHGAVVAQVQPGSPAEAAGIRQGDVIVGVGTHAVNSPEEAVNAIHNEVRNDKALALRIIRDGHAAFFAVNVDHAAPGGGSDDDSAG
jgi:serine protease Do